MFDRATVPDHYYGRDNRIGMIAPDFDLEEVDIKFLEKSEAFLENHVKESPEKPFFLLHSTQAVHLPSFAAEQFKGRTKAGPHGDFIFHFDAIVGRLMKKLDELGVAENTLVMISSDNGPELPTAQDMRRTYGHDGARPWRGLKRDNWEGGHRVPFVVRWPGKVKPGSESAQVVSLTDVMATCAEIVGYKLPKDAAEDSVSILGTLDGSHPEAKPIREYPVQEAIRGFSIRHGKWKFLDHQGSGGNRYHEDGYWGARMFVLPEAEPDSPGQLYDLAADPGETTNIYSKHPEVVKRLKAKLEAIKEAGRSAPWPRE
jgi:arylsulfatase A-like enzyme